MALAPVPGASYAAPQVEAIATPIDHAAKIAHDGDVILSQQVRAIGTVTIDGEVSGAVPVGAQSVPVHIVSGAELYHMRRWTEAPAMIGRLYCSTERAAFPGEPSQVSHGCVSDDDGDGAFDHLWLLRGDGAPIEGGPMYRAPDLLGAHPTYTARTASGLSPGTLLILFKCDASCVQRAVQVGPQHAGLLQAWQQTDGVRAPWMWDAGGYWNESDATQQILGAHVAIDALDQDGTLHYRVLSGLGSGPNPEFELGPMPLPVAVDTPGH